MSSRTLRSSLGTQAEFLVALFTVEIRFAIVAECFVALVTDDHIFNHPTEGELLAHFAEVFAPQAEILVALFTQESYPQSQVPLRTCCRRAYLCTQNKTRCRTLHSSNCFALITECLRTNRTAPRFAAEAMSSCTQNSRTFLRIEDTMTSCSSQWNHILHLQNSM
jgi:hypothetical protein